MNALGGRLAHLHTPVIGGGVLRFEFLVGEETGTPGLVVVPELTGDGSGFTGAWRVAHQGSGRAVSPPYGAVGEALAAADRLGSVGLARWDRTPFAPAGREHDVAALVERALAPTLTLAAG